MSGCAVDKRPETYSNTIVVNSLFPAHGSSQDQYLELQNALLNRNLLIADNGDVLPAMKGMCEADVLYRVTDANLPPYIGSHQDLYSGFYLDVALINGNWLVVSTDSDFTEYKAEFSLSLLATLLTPRTTSDDLFFIRPQPNASKQELDNLLASVQGILPSRHTRFVVPNAYASQVEQAGYRSVLSHADGRHWYLGNSLASNSAQERLFFALNNQANAELVAIVAQQKLLTACVQAHNFVPPPSKKFKAKSKNNSLPYLVSVLPENADFSQLEQQQTLIKSGQYLTLNGDVLKYSTYQKIQASSRCSRLDPKDPLFKYCKDRKQDVSTEFTRRKATMRKQG